LPRIQILRCEALRKKICHRKFALSAIDPSPGVKNGSGVGMKLLLVVRAAIASVGEERPKQHQKKLVKMMQSEHPAKQIRGIVSKLTMRK
jgi:hypothetical protein